MSSPPPPPPPAIYLEHKNWGWSLYLMMVNTLYYLLCQMVDSSASCHSMKCREETEHRTVIKSATFLRLVHVPLLLAGWCCFNFNASSKSQSAIGHGITRSLTGTHTNTHSQGEREKKVDILLVPSYFVLSVAIYICGNVVYSFTWWVRMPKVLQRLVLDTIINRDHFPSSCVSLVIIIIVGQARMVWYT